MGTSKSLYFAALVSLFALVSAQSYISQAYYKDTDCTGVIVNAYYETIDVCQGNAGYHKSYMAKIISNKVIAYKFVNDDCTGESVNETLGVLDECVRTSSGSNKFMKGKTTPTRPYALINLFQKEDCKQENLAATEAFRFDECIVDTTYSQEDNAVNVTQYSHQGCTGRVASSEQYVMDKCYDYLKLVDIVV